MINKDRTTISKEIRNHRIKKESLDPFRKNAKTSKPVQSKVLVLMSTVMTFFAGHV